MTYEIIFADRHRFLHLLADGWRLPFIVEPMLGSHGLYSILMTRGEA